MKHGFGLYIPCIALVALLGMSIGAAFPIMMGSCTLLMVVSVPKWAKMGTFNLNAVLIGGIFGSFGAVAAYLLLKYAFDLHTLAYLMCVVMVYTAVLYIRDVMKAKKIS